MSLARSTAFAGTMTLCILSGCDEVRDAVHRYTAPADAGQVSAVAPTATSAAPLDAGAPPADASTEAGAVDAGKKAAPVPTATATSAAKKQPPLNGLPAGAPCIEGQGNGGCASGSECTNGKCTCYYGWTSCGGACRDLSRDPYNCDKCGHECQYGQYCKWGHCE